jgi:biopolymer transport protein ExbD
MWYSFYWCSLYTAFFQFVIGVKESGEILIKGEPATIEDLRKGLAQAAADTVPVYVAGDEKAEYKKVMIVCDEIRKAGIKDFGFSVNTTENSK